MLSSTNYLRVQNPPCAGTPVGSNRMTYLQRVQVIITGKQGGHHQLVITFKKYQNVVRHPLGVGNLNFVKERNLNNCAKHTTPVAVALFCCFLGCDSLTSTVAFRVSALSIVLLLLLLLLFFLLFI